MDKGLVDEQEAKSGGRRCKVTMAWGDEWNNSGHGPWIFLFLLFINDLPSDGSHNDESLIMLLADDTKTYQRIDTEEEQQVENQKELQTRVDKIARWARDWKMEIKLEQVENHAPRKK